MDTTASASMETGKPSRFARAGIRLPAAPMTSHKNNIKAMMNSLPWNWVMYSLMSSSWATTLEIPVATTSRKICFGFTCMVEGAGFASVGVMRRARPTAGGGRPR
jgi:hypothetical protein